MLLNLIASVAAMTSTAAASADTPGKNDVHVLFRRLEGRWNCAGAFANGSVLHSTLAFTRSVDGNRLRLRHADMPPNTYRAGATWSIDKKSGELVSLAWLGKAGSADESAALYVADEISPSSVMLRQRALLGPPWAANRFRYSIEGGVLAIEWQIERNGQWRTGDHLRCLKPVR